MCLILILLIVIKCITLVIYIFKILLSQSCRVVTHRLPYWLLSHLLGPLVGSGVLLVATYDGCTVFLLSVYWRIVITRFGRLCKVFGCLVYASILLIFVTLVNFLSLSLILLMNLQQTSLNGLIFASCDGCFGLRSNLSHLYDIVFSLI